MDDDAALDVVRDAAAQLADLAGRDLDRPVATYPGWSVADVVAHTGRIQRWVDEIVRTRATRRLPQPELARRPDDLVGWFRVGAARLLNALEATAASTPVWTLTSESTAGFWRRRMALETTIHRWDVQAAFGDPPPIRDAVAAAGVTEALHVYLESRLRGADVGGGGEVVGLRTRDGSRSWAVRLRPDAIDVLDSDHDVDVRAEATASTLWLFLMGRVGREALDVAGPVLGVERLQDAVALLPAPRH